MKRLLLPFLALVACDYHADLGNARDGALSVDGQIAHDGQVGSDGPASDGRVAIDGAVVDAGTDGAQAGDGGTTCTVASERLVTTGTDSCTEPSFVIDPTGASHLAWWAQVGNSQGEYARAPAGGSWSVTHGAFGTGLIQARIGADATGKPLALTDTGSGGMTMWTGLPWMQRALPGINVAPRGRALAFDAAGGFHAVIRPTTMDAQNMYQWGVDYLTGPPDSPSASHLVVGSSVSATDFMLGRDGTPYVLYFYNGDDYLQSPPAAAQKLPSSGAPSEHWFEAIGASSMIATGPGGAVTLLGVRRIQPFGTQEMIVARKTGTTWDVRAVGTSTVPGCRSTPAIGDTCVVDTITYGPTAALVTRSGNPLLVTRKVHEQGTQTWQCTGDCFWNGTTSKDAVLLTAEIPPTGPIAFVEVPVALDASAQLSAAADSADRVHVIAVENSAQFAAGPCRIRDISLSCGP